jgi:folate-dependent phosphoribosylglycinamide formyltransferase PurN
MRFGIITADQELYTKRLIYFLSYNHHKPDLVLLVRHGIFSRIRRNLNLQAVISLIRTQTSGNETISAEPSTDHLARYLDSVGVNIPHTSLKEACRNKGIPLLITNDLHSVKTCELLRKSELDIMINAGGGIYKPCIIETIRIGILNAHMGLLPEMRGMNVLEWSIFYGRIVGVTVHLIDRGIDTGDILSFRQIPIDEGDSISDLRDKSAIANFELFAEVLNGFRTDSVVRKKQSREIGLQYFVMHPRLRSCVIRKLRDLAAGKSTIPVN